MDLIKGDITTLDLDCIVNAANESLMPGGGVCGAIHKAAGKELAMECKRIGHCGVGEARITSGYDLKAKKTNPITETTSLETEINKLVYELYGLTDEEIAIVEDSVG
tara:strand:- start:3379 stop:3699 length:321 start_codon:yes stop_codon:yes gene_type:complete